MICRITVTGVVQGVGYRPFAARLAKELSIEGSVKNSGGSVIISVSGTREAVEEYIHRLKLQKPSGALVLEVKAENCHESPAYELPMKGTGGFTILQSDQVPLSELPMIAPDLGVCSHCLKEMNSSSDRRHGHAFISCTSCGPRYSMIRKLPYDRSSTVMEAFSMCQPCRAEYEGEGRRQHAQTISCCDCGPKLFYEGLQEDAAFYAAVKKLKNGEILAVKGIGGFQLVCLPQHEETVQYLRFMKGREKKPFAVMFEELEQIREVCEVSKREEELLTSSARPIVLLHKKKEVFGVNVSGDSRYLGVFLPNTPLHSLLLRETGPLIVTSCNLSSEPIMTKEDQVLDWNPPKLKGVLDHDREILSPLDDSVAYVSGDRVRLVRRSRGYVPLPILLSPDVRRILPEIGSSVLAMGSDLKSVFGLFAGNRVVLSQCFGDMEHHAIYKAYREELDRLEGLLETRPEVAVCDLHPGYETVGLANRLLAEGKVKQVISVQHHHAHTASVMAEHGLDSCIGVAFDGTGYGTDGAIWGSEFFCCNGKDAGRRGHLEYVNFCGGDEVSKDGSLALLCYLANAGAPEAEIPDERYSLVQAALKTETATFRSCSMGRLFDAVSALLGIRKINTYEGECAIALENAAWEAIEAGKNPYSLGFSVTVQGGNVTEATWTASAMTLIMEMQKVFREGTVSAEELALGFHYAIAGLVTQICDLIRRETGELRVTLSGGVFANRLLTALCEDRLTKAGFTVYENEKVPCNDGGIALGQAYLAAFMIENRRKEPCV